MKKNKVSPAARAAILLAVIGVPLLFIAAVAGTNYISESTPLLLAAVVVVGIAAYVGMTTRLLYQFCEGKMPWYGWLPCFGELAMLDRKFLEIGSIFYAVGITFLALSQLPYSVLSFLPRDLALYFPFFTIGIALVAFAGIQVIKGLGLIHCIKFVEAEWEERMHSNLGLIKSLSLLGFIPFVRVLGIYALNKPLSTMVTFRNVTISDNAEISLKEEA